MSTSRFCEREGAQEVCSVVEVLHTPAHEALAHKETEVLIGTRLQLVRAGPTRRHAPAS